MLLDLNDPKSIAQWWSVFPERHGALLRDWERRRPDVRGPIGQARRIIQADPVRRGQLERFEGASASRSFSVAVPSHDEMAAGELTSDADTVEVEAQD
ncbi:hypothetical protein CDN99_21695 [Roseateles aquatilis]|uniref:Uncharacterized protein n=2 Tax=Roseateles aquatilis TaxID=431061 RepID=A0A246J0I3_9BURK|nr:hypothetical protein CDN99_21695 [Roseateles aquatilis]